MCTSVRHSPAPPISTITSKGPRIFGSGTSSTVGRSSYRCRRTAFTADPLAMWCVRAGPWRQTSPSVIESYNEWSTGGCRSCRAGKTPGGTRDGRTHMATTRTPEEVFAHHGSTLGAGDLEGILEDYTDDAILIVQSRIYRGKE